MTLTARIAEAAELDPAGLEEALRALRKANGGSRAAAFNDGLLSGALVAYHFAAVQKLKGKPVEAEFLESFAVLLCGQGVKS